MTHKISRRWILVALVPAFLFFASCGDGANEQGSAAGKKEAGKGGGHGHEEEASSSLKLTPEQRALIDIKVVKVSRGEVSVPLVMNGEIALNQDRTAFILPRVSGYVKEVLRAPGEEIRAGDLMAVIESRELTEIRTKYLLAREKVALAQSKFAREEQLFKQKISAQQEYQDARQALAEATLEQRAAEQGLRALGLDPRDSSQETSTAFRITTPIDGTVIERNVVLGQRLDDAANAFIVADLQSVWVIGSLNQKDIARVRPGQAAEIAVKASPGTSYKGQVTRISDVLDEKTRTLRVRVEVANRDRRLKPGMFARIEVAAETKSDVLVVPSSAIQKQKDEAFVFIETSPGEYERREIVLGSRSNDLTEIVFGLEEGEPVVSEGAFTLKSELDKAGFEAGHGH